MTRRLTGGSNLASYIGLSEASIVVDNDIERIKYSAGSCNSSNVVCAICAALLNGKDSAESLAVADNAVKIMHIPAINVMGFMVSCSVAVIVKGAF